MPTAEIAHSPDARGEQLQGKGDPIEDDRRNRNHQEQEGYGKPQDSQVRPPKQEDHDACDHGKDR